MYKFVYVHCVPCVQSWCIIQWNSKDFSMDVFMHSEEKKLNVADVTEMHVMF